MNRVYFDYNATTPLAPEVASAIQPYLESAYGNPSSRHWAGELGRAAIENARRQVAAFLGCDTTEVVFTSGGTESNNAVLAGVFFGNRKNKPTHFIISSVEHSSVAKPARFLEKLGAELTLLPVDRFCRLDPETVRRAIRPNTILISVMHANNEVGTIQPIPEIAAIAREHGIVMHTDAAQTAAKLRVNVHDLGVDLLSLAGHKMYAPQGVGVLFIRNGVSLEPLLHGAGHEAGRRPGTENVLEIVGLGAACELAGRLSDVSTIRDLRDHFWHRLRQEFGDRVALNGHPENRLPNTLNVSFVECLGGEILAQMPQVAASVGAACHEGTHELSPVLRAMGVPEGVGLGAIRFSLGRNSTYEEVETVVEQLAKVLPHAVSQR
jgi:cysteine desulfurase